MRPLLAALALLLSAMPLAARAGTTGSVAGYVLGFAGNPIAGASVRFESPAELATAVTDAHGYYSFVDLVPGVYRASFVHAGYEKNTTYARVVADEQAVLNVSLRPVLVALSIDRAYDPYSLLHFKIPDVYESRGDNSFTVFDQLRFVPEVTAPVFAPMRGMP